MSSKKLHLIRQNRNREYLLHQSCVKFTAVSRASMKTLTACSFKQTEPTLREKTGRTVNNNYDLIIRPDH